MFNLDPPTEEQFTLLVQRLTDDEKFLLLDHGEEAPYCDDLLIEKRRGVYSCRLCGLPLFTATAKYDSGTGWPSFTSPVSGDHLREVRDSSFGMVRVEVTCARCGAHQGHVFADGPQPTGKRYCINARCLEFTPAGKRIPDKLGRGSPEGDYWVV